MTLREHLSPLSVPGFRTFYIAEAVNTAGSAFTGVALAFAVLDISHSATALGIVAAAWSIPSVGFLMFGGALADRLPRAHLLRLCALVAGLAQAVTAALVITGAARIWHLVVLQVIAGVVSSISYPAYHGMVPILLPEGQRKAGFLLIAQSDSVLRILGPALAGILVAGVGAGWALAFDAASYLGTAALLIGLSVPIGERPDRRESVLADFRAGWAYSRQLGWVLPVASCSLVFNALLVGALFVVGPVLAKDSIGARGWGVVVAAEAVGVLVATLLLARLPLTRPLRVCIQGFMLSAVPMVALGSWLNTAVLFTAFFIMGLGMAAIGLAWNMTVQAKVTEGMLSRVMAIDGFFSFVGMPVGQLVVGPIAVLVGAQRLELGAAALCVLVGAVGLSVPAINRLRLEAEPTTTG